MLRVREERDSLGKRGRISPVLVSLQRARKRAADPLSLTVTGSVISGGSWWLAVRMRVWLSRSKGWRCVGVLCHPFQHFASLLIFMSTRERFVLFLPVLPARLPAHQYYRRALCRASAPRTPPSACRRAGTGDCGHYFYAASCGRLADFVRVFVFRVTCRHS